MASTSVTSPTGSVRSTSTQPDYNSPNLKIVVRFRNIGNAPILKQPVFKIATSQRIITLTKFLRAKLDCKDSDTLFLYVGTAFAPAPDETLGNLARSFCVDNSLVFYYSMAPAWG
ncbi:putative autophagy-related protein 12 [Linderina pennispora]|uniref:Ubiquitin-like protein ATG12 n=1 Tax=Linderina pennispora TaxID=61395 RepID=A0A1Y1WMS1_9FUNG|nr:putative autophagy-related protein 12 [Linderina pennispora]KAJ1940929.1 Ubiquitin-like protein [Linderina pennispora]ORX74506.1 putative autophagy-related protein 12 [Linderina pennispora]